MNIDELTVEVRDESFNRVGQILPKDLVGFKAVLRFNNVGSWEIVLPQGHEVGDILRLPGSGIVVTGPSGVILSGPTVSATSTQTSDNPNGDWSIIGVDDSVILGERLAYPSPTVLDVAAQTATHDTRMGIASTAMYGYVRANMGSTAPVGRRIDNLTLATDTGIGSYVYPSARFDILGELLSGIASVDGLGFGIQQSGTSLLFSVFQPVDRSGYIRMDVANNTLSKTEYAYGSHSLSRAIVAGQGEGLNRQFLEITSTESIAAENLWNRRIETFLDQRNTSDVNELTQAGKEKLADGGATVTSVDVVPSNDMTMTYGSDWNLGDKVTVVVDGQEVSSIVTTVSMSVESDGIRIGATVGEPTGVDYESKMAKRTTSTTQRVNSLERKEAPAITWNDTDGTYEFTLKGGNVTLQIGQEQVAYVKNNTGATLNNGSAVYPTGSTGANNLVALAQANSEAASTQTFGILTENIANGAHGFVTTFGMVHDINTSALTEGAAVWLSPTVAGGLTSTKPSAPNHMVLIGFCVRSHATTGVIFVKVQNGFEFAELHDVAITSAAAGDIVVRNATNTGWKNSTLAAAGIATTAQVSSSVPTGAIMQWFTNTAPSGWIFCHGQSTSGYTALAAVIGATVPNLQTRVPVGRNSDGTGTFGTLGATGGAETVALSSGQMPAHTHTFSGTTSTDGWHGHGLSNNANNMVSDANVGINWTTAGGGSYGFKNSTILGNGSHSHTYSGTTSSNGSGTAHNNLQPYITLNYIIKT